VVAAEVGEMLSSWSAESLLLTEETVSCCFAVVGLQGVTSRGTGMVALLDGNERDGLGRRGFATTAAKFEK